MRLRLPHCQIFGFAVPLGYTNCLIIVNLGPNQKEDDLNSMTCQNLKVLSDTLWNIQKVVSRCSMKSVEYIFHLASCWDIQIYHLVGSISIIYQYVNWLVVYLPL